jgi:hypothetical protein
MLLNENKKTSSSPRSPMRPPCVTHRSQSFTEDLQRKRPGSQIHHSAKEYLAKAFWRREKGGHGARGEEGKNGTTWRKWGAKLCLLGGGKTAGGVKVFVFSSRNCIHGEHAHISKHT